jgi:hypothetical protein
MNMKVRRFDASIAYTTPEGKTQEEEFPVRAADYAAANRIALDYVLKVLKLDDFELRIVGA